MMCFELFHLNFMLLVDWFPFWDELYPKVSYGISLASSETVKERVIGYLCHVCSELGQ